MATQASNISGFQQSELSAELAGFRRFVRQGLLISVAETVTTGDVSPLVRALGSAIYDALKDVLGYL